MGRPDEENERKLHPELEPLMKRAGEAISRIRAGRDGVVSVELDGDGGDDLFFTTGHGPPDMRRGKAPQGMAHVLRVRGNAERLREALKKARTPGELLGSAGLEIEGSVDVANQLVPHLLRLLAEAKRAAD